MNPRTWRSQYERGLAEFRRAHPRPARRRRESRWYFVGAAAMLALPVGGWAIASIFGGAAAMTLLLVLIVALFVWASV